MLGWILLLDFAGSPAPPLIPVHLALLLFASHQRTHQIQGRQRTQTATMTQRRLAFTTVGGQDDDV